MKQLPVLWLVPFQWDFRFKKPTVSDCHRLKFAMAPSTQPLLGEKSSKLSMIYGVNEYEEMLRAKMAQNSEIAQLKALSPDQEGLSASGAEGMLKSGTEADGKSKKGKREFPTPNKPDPMPRELEFLFTRISPEQMLYMWNVYTALFCSQCACVLAYCFMLAQGLDWYLATALFSVPMAMLMIQNVYILHDAPHLLKSKLFRLCRFLLSNFYVDSMFTEEGWRTNMLCTIEQSKAAKKESLTWAATVAQNLAPSGSF